MLKIIAFISNTQIIVQHDRNKILKGQCDHQTQLCKYDLNCTDVIGREERGRPNVLCLNCRRGSAKLEQTLLELGKWGSQFVPPSQ